MLNRKHIGAALSKTENTRNCSYYADACISVCVSVCVSSCHLNFPTRTFLFLLSLSLCLSLSNLRMVLGFRAHSTHARTTTTFDGIYLHACVRAIGRYCGAAMHDFGLRDVLMVDLFGRVVVFFFVLGLGGCSVRID